MKLKAYAVIIIIKTAHTDGCPEIKIFRRRYDAEKYLTDNKWYEAFDGRWFHPLLSSVQYEARIRKFVF